MPKTRKKRKKKYPFRENILISTVGNVPTKYYSVIYLDNDLKTKSLYLKNDISVIKKKLREKLNFNLTIEEINKRIEKCERKLFQKVLLYIRNEVLNSERKKEELIIFFNDIFEEKRREKIL